MSHDFESLYNKYRPKTFDHLVGQEHISSTLKRAFAKKKLVHAYLLCGSRGSGKTTTARILAMGYNCANGVVSDPCGECEFCQDILLNRSIDFIEYDTASKNKVDDIRELTASAATVSSQLRTKFYIMDEVHMMTPAAQNAFLKTLEEPPPHVVFILCTTEPDKLKDTIISRTQLFEFRRITDSKIAKHLKYIAEQEGYTADDNALLSIAKVCAGGMRDAIGKLDVAMCACDGNHISLDVIRDAIGTTGSEYCPKLTEAIQTDNIAEIMHIIGKVADGTAVLHPFFMSIASYFRDMMAAAVNPDYINNLDITDEQKVTMSKQSSAWSIAKWLDAMKIVLGYERMIDSIKGRMVLETMCLEVMMMGKAIAPPTQFISNTNAIAQPSSTGSDSRIEWDVLKEKVEFPLVFILDNLTPKPYYNDSGLILPGKMDEMTKMHLNNAEKSFVEALQKAGLTPKVIFSESENAVSSASIFGA
jgi:DNA polymerase-3 subunit gamma/tau